MKDAYTLLGLEPGVPPKDIKRAFRRLAMQWHPDRNPDPAALEHFKALRAAYEHVLAHSEIATSDEEATPQPPTPPRDSTARGADRHQDLTLTIEEAWLGCEKSVRVAHESTCPTCDGGGTEKLAHTQLCKECHGSGRIRVTDGHGLHRCKTCEGRGYRTQRTCTACEGSGRVQAWRTLAVKIPPGLLTGDELRVAGAGESSTLPDGDNGDLRLRVRLAEHALYRLEGRDLRMSRPISALRMLAGGDIEVPLPAGPLTLTIFAGAAAPRELRIEAAGFPAGRGQAAGALVVELHPVMPEGCNTRQQRLLAELDAELSANASRHYPTLAAWEADWLSSRPPARD